MPQDSETGRQGCASGYSRADKIGALLGAERLAKNSNEFRWDSRIVVIKTGSSAVVTRATLGRVVAIVYGSKRLLLLSRIHWLSPSMIRIIPKRKTGSSPLGARLPVGSLHV